MDRQRKEEEERVLAAQKAREREEREERERKEREEKLRLERERAETAPKSSVRGSGVRGVRGTRASTRGMRGTASVRGGVYYLKPLITHLSEPIPRLAATRSGIPASVSAGGTTGRRPSPAASSRPSTTRGIPRRVQ